MAPPLRFSGPVGKASINGKTYLIDTWAIFAGNPDLEDQCPGWFRCTDPTFTARRTTAVHLELTSWQGVARAFEATITVNLHAKRLWQFLMTETARSVGSTG
jgi:hypothetical protein